jgi:hypothetical protein
MKGFQKGMNFKTSANSQFKGAGCAPVKKFAEGGHVAIPDRTKKPRPKQSLASAADEQDFADKNYNDPRRETVRIGNTKKSYKEAKDAQAKRDFEKMPGGPYKYAQGGAVLAGAGSGVHRMQVQQRGYAKGGEVCTTIVDKQIAKHVARPAPKGHKGLKA